MIKITHVLTDSNIGGAGILLSNLLARIDENKFSFEVLLPRGAALSSRLSRLGVRYEEIDIMPDRSFSVGDFFTLLKRFKLDKPDVLHTHGALSARMAGKCAGVSVCMLTRHCDTPLKMPSFIYNASTDYTVATSRSLYENLLGYGVPSDRLSLIKNGSPEQKRANGARISELKKELSVPENAFCVGCVGRLEKIKGQAILLHAAREILAREKDFFFIFVGGGGDEAELRALARLLGIESRALFVGHRERVDELLSLFDVLVNCSLGSETSSLAISEAMSLSLPVVASDISGNADMIENGVSGLLFERGNPSALKDALLTLFYNENLKRSLGLGARERYEREFTVSAMAKKYESLYLSLSGKRL
jgi:glycosyltransferase involved in cell wall biosynthesis